MESSKDYFIHPSSDVKTDKIGSGTKIWQFVVVLEGTQIGNNCNINCHTFFEDDVILGDNVTVKSGVYLWNGIRVHDNVFIGPSVTFINDHTPRSQQYPEQYAGATLEEHVSIGANSTIMGGINIGKGAMIGAGSVVTRDVPPFTLWYGNPAKHAGYVTLNGVILDMQLTDQITGKMYEYVNNEVLPI